MLFIPRSGLLNCRISEDYLAHGEEKKKAELRKVDKRCISRRHDKRCTPRRQGNAEETPVTPENTPCFKHVYLAGDMGRRAGGPMKLPTFPVLQHVHRTDRVPSSFRTEEAELCHSSLHTDTTHKHKPKHAHARLQAAEIT